MNEIINNLKTELMMNHSKCEVIEQKIQVEYNKIFDADQELKNIIIELDNSTDYGSDEYGEIYVWTRYYISKEYKKVSKYLEEYLQEEYFIQIDFNNDAIYRYIGQDFIAINEEGDIFQEDKCIIEAKE